jgi:farnesyl diphosphate synthase
LSNNKTIQENDDAYNKIMEKSIVVGWCIELVRMKNVTMFVVFNKLHFLTQLCDAIKLTEDFVSGKRERNGKSTWHLKSKMGSLVFNETLLITGGVFYVLKQHFENEPFYNNLITAFKDAQFKRSLSNVLVHNKIDKDEEYKSFNLERYNEIMTNAVEIDVYLPVISSLLIVSVFKCPNVTNYPVISFFR